MSENPYNPLRPVTDPMLFYGRQDAVAFLTFNLSGRRTHKALVILGQRGIGKSSLLAQVPLVVDERYPAIKIDAAALELDNTVTFVATIVDQTRAMMKAIQASTYRLPAFPDPTDPTIDLLTWLADEYLDVLFSAIRRSRHLVLMIDNTHYILDAMQAGHFPAHFMQYWQDLLERYEQLDLLFVVDIADEDRILQTPPMDDTSLHYRLSHLEREEAKQALTEPVLTHYGFSEEALEQILRLTGGHPYLIHTIGHLLHRRWEADRNRINIITPHDVNAIIPAALESTGDTIDNLWAVLRPNERLILTSLLDLRTPAHVEALAEWLTSAGYNLGDVQIAAALRGLEYYSVITALDDGTYALASELQAEWLRRRQRITPTDTPNIDATSIPFWLYVGGGLFAVVLFAGILLLAGSNNDNTSDTVNSIDATITLETDAQRTLSAEETRAAQPVLTPLPQSVFRFGG